MDIEKLTKQQIVLVTLLVSFVTSIATGIVTVALMDQAPAGVTQTINRVVERTIEKVVTEPSNNAAAVVTRETIVVKEDDKITEAVEKNKESVVRIYANIENAGDVEQTRFIGLGTIISSDGLIVTGDTFADQNGEYIVTLDNQKFYNVTILAKKNNNQLYFLEVVQDKKNPVKFTPVTLSDSDTLKLGQTVIAWGGLIQNSISTGIISSLINNTNAINSQHDQETASTTETTKKIMAINTNVNLSESLSGGPLLNLSGEVIGLRVASTISELHSYLPANIIRQEMTGYNN